MNSTRLTRQLAALAAFALLATACGDSSAATSPPATSEPPPTTVTSVSAPPPTTVPPATTAPPFECPATIPVTGAFAAPEPYPPAHPDEGLAWYGDDGLWTALPLDGDHGQRKSVWWSANFPGGGEEERPAIQVTWTRLDADPPVVHRHDEPGTNAFTGNEGWFMMSGIDPPDAGCWQVEATYKGATLSYVYEMP